MSIRLKVILPYLLLTVVVSVIGVYVVTRLVAGSVQERLTKQIADCLSYILKTEDVAVYIKAKHYCVISRGVKR